jgi:hypothetical protein
VCILRKSVDHDQNRVVWLLQFRASSANRSSQSSNEIHCNFVLRLQRWVHKLDLSILRMSRRLVHLTAAAFLNVCYNLCLYLRECKVTSYILDCLRNARVTVSRVIVVVLNALFLVSFRHLVFVVRDRKLLFIILYNAQHGIKLMCPCAKCSILVSL